MDSVNIKIFEKIKKNSKNKQEFWSARQLSKTLEYADFCNFKKVINDAQKSC
ncbi:MAG: hypothetical protein GW754_00535 [Candidatus Pacebacteria bacterium]|nr:hypothetical protein [Candidatus Pacearchaeota archaeon]NCQ65304.1 hypothetical protein [Candidatus Paceibacterota bacterium]NCS86403.1 hypothetical protein [Candidatus Paceibacterota bacterium]